MPIAAIQVKNPTPAFTQGHAIHRGLQSQIEQIFNSICRNVFKGIEDAIVTQMRNTCIENAKDTHSFLMSAHFILEKELFGKFKGPAPLSDLIRQFDIQMLSAGGDDIAKVLWELDGQIQHICEAEGEITNLIDGDDKKDAQMLLTLMHEQYHLDAKKGEHLAKVHCRHCAISAKTGEPFIVKHTLENKTTAPN